MELIDVSFLESERCFSDKNFRSGSFVDVRLGLLECRAPIHLSASQLVVEKWFTVKAGDDTLCTLFTRKVVCAGDGIYRWYCVWKVGRWAYSYRSTMYESKLLC